MDDSPMGLIKYHMRRNHQRLLSRIENLTDEQLTWRPPSNAPSLGFHIWHIAHWADLLLEVLKGPGSQLWDQENLSERWGLNAKTLGFAESGTSMDEEELAQLSLSRNDLVGYLRRAFAVVDDAVDAINDEEFQRTYTGPLTEDWWLNRTIGYIIMVHLTHEIRHVGMVEALLGAQGVDVKDYVSPSRKTG